MGLDFSYLLYFKQVHLLNAFHGLEEIAEEINPPIKKYFPNYKNPIAIKFNGSGKKKIYHDDPELDFATVLLFEEDEDILCYVNILDQGKLEPWRRILDKDGKNRIGIGFIYLTVYNNLQRESSAKRTEDDLVLFKFGTTGTKMSLLFDCSKSIRKTFVELLEKYQGVCGVFNREDGGGELFWLKGQGFSKSI